MFHAQAETKGRRVLSTYLVLQTGLREWALHGEFDAFNSLVEYLLHSR